MLKWQGTPKEIGVPDVAQPWKSIAACIWFQGLHCMQPPSRVVCNSCHVFSHTTDRVPWCNLTIQKRHYSCFSLDRPFYWHAWWYLYYHRYNQTKQIKESTSSNSISSGHQGAHDLQQCCFTSLFLMAGRSAQMRVIWSEWSKNDTIIARPFSTCINWTLCLHHGWSEVEGNSVA